MDGFLLHWYIAVNIFRRFLSCLFSLFIHLFIGLFSLIVFILLFSRGRNIFPYGYSNSWKESWSNIEIKCWETCVSSLVFLIFSVSFWIFPPFVLLFNSRFCHQAFARQKILIFLRNQVTLPYDLRLVYLIK